MRGSDPIGTCVYYGHKNEGPDPVVKVWGLTPLGVQSKCNTNM